MNEKNPNGRFLRIDELWAWISHDEEGEGILGFGAIPLIGADQDRIESYRVHAQHIAKMSGKAVRLVRYTTRTEVETLTPPE
jgi:hypothetical protein